MDDLQLLIEVDPASLPSVEQVRAVCQPDAALPRQRVAIYLLLPNGAYLLDRKTPLEFWHMLQTPCANPEMYNLLGRPEFLIEGKLRTAGEYPWTKFAATLVEDEMRLRKSATAKAIAAAAGPSNSLLLLRGIWRHLQLDVMQRSGATGTVYVPLTVGGILRGMRTQGLPDMPILHELKEAYELERQDLPSRASKLIPEAIAMFSRAS
jgi:hypothetical protein